MHECGLAHSNLRRPVRSTSVNCSCLVEIIIILSWQAWHRGLSKFLSRPSSSPADSQAKLFVDAAPYIRPSPGLGIADVAPRLYTPYSVSNTQARTLVSLTTTMFASSAACTHPNRVFICLHPGRVPSHDEDHSTSRGSDKNYASNAGSTHFKLALQVCVWLLDPPNDVTIVTASVLPGSSVTVLPPSISFSKADWAESNDAFCQTFTILPGENTGLWCLCCQLPLFSAPCQDCAPLRA